MKSPRITNGFDRLNDAELEIKANAILAAMTGNANFPTPAPTLAELTTAIDEYSAAQSAAKTGDRVDIAIKKQKRESLTTLLHQLGDYVLFASKRDRVIMASSGFSVSREAQPLPPLAKPENLQVLSGANTGELLISIARVPGARAYQYQYTPDPLTQESVWETQLNTTIKNTFANLLSGTRYWCRVGAIGTEGQLVFSDAVSRVVL
jgi:hypothetical protein